MISWAFDSSIFSWSASRVGFAAWNLSRICCHVKLCCWACALFAREPAINSARKKSLTDRKPASFSGAILMPAADLAMPVSSLSTADE